MPYYQFINSKNEISEFFFEIAAAPPIGSKIKVGRKNYTRIPTNPTMSTDTRINPFDKQAFLDKTNKPGKFGDLVDLSRDLAEKRKQKTGGEDKIRENFVETSKKTRRGKFIDDLKT